MEIDAVRVHSRQRTMVNDMAPFNTKVEVVWRGKLRF